MKKTSHACLGEHARKHCDARKAPLFLITGRTLSNCVLSRRETINICLRLQCFHERGVPRAGRLGNIGSPIVMSIAWSTQLAGKQTRAHSHRQPDIDGLWSKRLVGLAGRDGDGKATGEGGDLSLDLYEDREWQSRSSLNCSCLIALGDECCHSNGEKTCPKWSMMK
jgi:hypothetical protein